jgi:hypothetical protein
MARSISNGKFLPLHRCVICCLPPANLKANWCRCLRVLEFTWDRALTDCARITLTVPDIAFAHNALPEKVDEVNTDF